MNAAERANSIALASQIAAAVNLFRVAFPDVRVDLKPWLNDADTQAAVDPDSIDLGFHFPGYSRSCACRSLLVQIRFFADPVDDIQRAIGVEVAGYDHRGQQWRVSTIDAWQFEGSTQPKPEQGDRLKTYCRDVLELFNGRSSSDSAA
ncbi:MAG: hypothetical protein EA001_15260 [Oscillatoriales cyanobacterium]|nr:MAG: hypothetical protein EA001_15260 [Oscillatoriales cyanobacterium]